MAATWISRSSNSAWDSDSSTSCFLQKDHQVVDRFTKIIRPFGPIRSDLVHSLLVWSFATTWGKGEPTGKLAAQSAKAVGANMRITTRTALRIIFLLLKHYLCDLETLQFIPWSDIISCGDNIIKWQNLVSWIKTVMWVLMTLMAIAISLYAFIYFMIPEMGDPKFKSHFATIPLFARLHIIPGGIALILGAFQFQPWLRKRWITF